MKKTYLLAICCLLMLQHAGSQSPQYQQNGVTVAGGNDRGSAANQLDEPNNIVVDANGNLIIADLNNHRIQKWAPGAASGVTVAGGNGPGTAPNQFNHTTDVRFDVAGNMYVADFDNHRVQKFAPGSTAGITVAGGNGQGAAANQLDHPAGIFVDATANIYIADYYNHRIQKWAPGATSGVTVAGGKGPGAAPDQLYYPNDVFVDAARNVYIPDQNNHRVQKWAPGALSGTTVAGGNGPGMAPDQLNFPTGIWVDASGNIYVADFTNDRVQKFVPGSATGVTIVGGNGLGSAPNQFYHPLNLFFDNLGNLFVSDVFNHRVQRFDVIRPCPADIVITLASCTAKATISWTEPADSFPDTIRIPQYLDETEGTLTFMGSLNRHGYCKSTSADYLWPVARDICTFIGDTGVDGHLVTITSEAESNYLAGLIRGSGWSPWIGLYSTGKPGSFRWVTDEPLSYTRWTPGEPNNYQGNAANVVEPYVHMYDAGIWNDQRSIRMPFIAEFEKPLIHYRQISGPANGSQQGVGSYMACYERTNMITDKKDTCCFSITVKCNPVPFSEAAGTSGSVRASSADKAGTGLKAIAFPNPSSNQFSLNIASGYPDKIQVQVLDITGKVVETRSGLAPNQTLQIGNNLRAGVYFVELKQGSRTIQMKMVKQSK